MIDVGSLHYFQAAYEAGSFSAAARTTGVSQPSVSASIAKLEDRCGGPLFHRRRNGLVPTALGTWLYGQSGPILSQLNTLENSLDEQVRHLRIYCQPDVLIEPFQPALNNLVRKQAAVRLQFSQSADNADLCLSSIECIPSGFGFLPLWDESYGVAVSQKHALAAKGGVKIEDLAGEPLIARPYCPGADQHLASIGGSLSVAAEAVHDAQLLSLVSAGLGIALVPMSHGAASSNLLVLPLAEGRDVRRQVGIAFRRTQFASEMAKVLAEQKVVSISQVA
ncbi:MAG: LysR family transcriptional regulator [Roseibium sp.]